MTDTSTMNILTCKVKIRYIDEDNELEEEEEDRKRCMIFSFRLGRLKIYEYEINDLSRMNKSSFNSFISLDCDCIVVERDTFEISRHGSKIIFTQYDQDQDSVFSRFVAPRKLVMHALRKALSKAKEGIFKEE